MGGTGPTGGLPSTANGAFQTPILLANQPGGPTLTYRLLLNESAGITLAAGQRLTIRLYFSCGSTSSGRYGLLKNVVVKGENITVLSNKPLAGSGLNVFPNPATSHVAVELSGYSKATELCLYNVLGQPVQRLDVPGKAGIQRTTFNLSQLPAGVYLLRTRTEGGSDVRRILKQ
ncbi:T9SS type A sorting domain-containing protein [Hymenobacter volaticus]|uniref:T9SS type A sorting domain-containing protein n=2 Tax=Hymenobacter volaticus TaxID=2932254 RepID=A0ABY4GCF1_9BACT|nr:T9SS type A sorting domain-containing protein [Hymenobacter volaticus]